jgi:hypothetical protein
LAGGRGGRPAGIGLKAVIERFLELAEDSHPFSYTDLIADFLADVHAVVPDVSLRRATMEPLLILGYERNRFHAAGSSRDSRPPPPPPPTPPTPPTPWRSAKALRDNPEAVPFNAFYLWQQLLPQQLVRVLDELA